MGKLSEHFSEDEFRCRCCGKLPERGMNPELIERLELLRALVGRPLVPNSGYRCSRHNAEVGGAANSQHMKGTAADILAAGIGVEELARAAEKVGFRGIGRYKRKGFVHVDVRSRKARWEGK